MQATISPTYRKAPVREKCFVSQYIWREAYQATCEKSIGVGEDRSQNIERAFTSGAEHCIAASRYIRYNSKT